MTAPTDDSTGASQGALLKRWLNRYMTVQAKYDSQIKSLLKDGANDAQQRISVLDSKLTFSAGVQSAQQRMVLAAIKPTYRILFKEIIPIIQRGQKDEAGAASDGLTETDLQYLRAALAATTDIESFIKSERQRAEIGVIHALSRITKSKQPLSARVYRTQALANNWIYRVINSSILRGDSAKQIATQVKSNISPDTPGGTSYAALRLGRTELNNAFHATAITLSQDRPWITGMQWNTSRVHEDDPTEICTRLNGQIFTLDQVPAKPHPQCRCYVAPTLESATAFSNHLSAGTYRDWIEANSDTQQAA
jgi:SPP1 gp7 family putative phage head morphogenesis protein